MKLNCRYLLLLLTIAFLNATSLAQSGNKGKNLNIPASSLDVSGNLSVGSTYSGDSIPPVNGAIIEGDVGIGTASPVAKLDVNGSLRIANGTQGAGKFLVSDANGLATWDSLTIGNLLAPSSSPAPSCMFVAGAVATGTKPYFVTTSGHYAYVANAYSDEFQIFDISDPANPTLTGSVLSGDGPYFITLSGNYAYVANVYGHTMSILDITDPANPSVTGSVGTGVFPYAVAVSGNYAYVVNNGPGNLQVIDIVDPANPVVVGAVPTGIGPVSVTISGHYAIVTVFSINALKIFDITAPTTPVEVGSVTTDSRPIYTTVVGSYAYVVNSLSNSMQIIDLSDPMNPSVVGSMGTNNNPRCVSVSGSYAYVACHGNSTMQVIDISNPAGPTLVGTVNTDEGAQSVVVNGNYAFVVNNVANTFQAIQLFCSQLNLVSNHSGAMELASPTWRSEGQHIVNTNTGNVGIGTGTPATLLHLANSGAVELSIQSTSTGGRRWTLQSNPASASIKTQFQIIDRTAGSSRLAIDSLGRVGIGTTSPLSKLDVEGGVAIGAGYSGNLAAPVNGAIIQGKVGIGTDAPGTLLHLANSGAVELSIQSTSTGGRRWTMQSNPASASVKTEFQIIDRTAGSSRLAIDSLGRVGIGTTSPANRFDVEGGVAIGSSYSGTSAAPSNGAIIEGKVGIGTASPFSKIHISSNSPYLTAMEGDHALGSWLSIGNTPFNNWFHFIVAGEQNGIGTDKMMLQGSSSPLATESLIMAFDRSTARVGIGTVTPANRLDVEGGMAVGNNYSGTSVAPANGAIIEGHVGIGTAIPQAPLHVSGTSGTNSGTNIKYFNSVSPNITSATNWQGQTAILAIGNICATESFIAGASFNFSDARIKNIIGRTDGAEDLERLNQIEITRYTHKDTVGKSNAVQTKVIAQQLEKVMPEAVSYIRDFIPNVMQIAERMEYLENEQLLTVSLSKNHELKAGDHLKCINEQGQELFLDVLSTPNENTLLFTTDRHPEKLFIYGKQVDDFHIVDYDAIAMLNVSATQELARQLIASGQEVSQLKTEVAALKEQLSEMNALKKQMARLEAAWQTFDLTAREVSDQ